MTLVSNGMLNAFKMAHAGIDMGQNPDADQTTLITSLFGFVTIYNQYVDGMYNTTSLEMRILMTNNVRQVFWARLLVF